MRLAALAAALLFAALPVAPARAALTQPTGTPCELDLTTMRSYVDDYEDPEFSGGPVVLTDEDDPTVVHTGTLTCSLVFGNATDHTAPVYASATSDAATRVVVLPPTTVDTEPIGWGEPLSLCTRVDFDGGTLYWNDPHDRNTDGWWSPSPLATCNRLYETLDLRPQDPPLGPPLTLASNVLGEADVAVGPAQEAQCAAPVVRDLEIEGERQCDYPPLQAAYIAFARTAASGALVRATPYGWACTDVHTGDPVTRGSALTTPDPGVACAPPPSFDDACRWMELSAYLVPATLGRVTVTETCGAKDITRVLTPAQGRVVEQWSGAGGAYYGTGLPLRCAADEDTVGAAEPSYAVNCGLWAL